MEVKFKCQPDCGKCCISRGQYGFVFLTEMDMKNLEAYLGIPRSDWATASDFLFTRRSNGIPERAWYFTGGEKQCRFLQGTKCSVYEARPVQCRTFPFWPENMNPRVWDTLKEFCPGIGKGKEWDDEDIGSTVAIQVMADALER